MTKKVKKILSALGCKSDSELSILFVDATEMRGINRQYLNRDYPTDVISFSMKEGELSDLNENMLGDVIVSLDDASEYAQKKGVTLLDEVLFLLIHGILHIVGYAHESESSDKEAMQKKEVELYTMLKED